jgi:hypothetical protein
MFWGAIQSHLFIIGNLRAEGTALFLGAQKMRRHRSGFSGMGVVASIAFFLSLMFQSIHAFESGLFGFELINDEIAVNHIDELIQFLGLDPSIASDEVRSEALALIPHNVTIDISPVSIKNGIISTICMLYIPTYLFHFDRADIIEKFGSGYFILPPSDMEATRFFDESAPRQHLPPVNYYNDKLLVDADMVRSLEHQVWRLYYFFLLFFSEK